MKHIRYMKMTSLYLYCLMACFSMPAFAIEASVAGIEGPKAAISVIETKIDSLTAMFAASLKTLQTQVSTLQVQVTQVQAQNANIMSCAASSALYNGTRCVAVATGSSTTNNNNNNTSTSSSYSWSGSWGACPVVSGGGTQSMVYKCVSNSTGGTVADSYCTATASKPSASTQKCGLITKTPLNCTSTSWAAVNLYKGLAGRCADDSGMLYWDQQRTSSGLPDATIKANFTSGYNTNCAAYGTTSWSVCNTKWLCNTGFSYVANSTQCQ